MGATKVLAVGGLALFWRPLATSAPEGSTRKFGPPTDIPAECQCQSLYGGELVPIHASLSGFGARPSRRTRATQSSLGRKRRVDSFGLPGTASVATGRNAAPSSLVISVMVHWLVGVALLALL